MSENKVDYRGKWVSKSESDEEGLQYLNVIEVDGDEIKAVGRNLHVNELLMRFERLEDSNVKFPDPFAIQIEAFPGEQDFIVEEPIDDKNHIQIEQSSINMVKTNQNDDVYILGDNSSVKASDFGMQKSPYTKEQTVILDLIETAVSTKPVTTKITIPLEMNLNFDVLKFKSGAEMLGLGEEVVASGIAIYLEKLLNEGALNEAIIKALDSDKIESKI